MDGFETARARLLIRRFVTQENTGCLGGGPLVPLEATARSWRRAIQFWADAVGERFDCLIESMNFRRRSTFIELGYRHFGVVVGRGQNADTLREVMTYVHCCVIDGERVRPRISGAGQLD